MTDADAFAAWFAGVTTGVTTPAAAAPTPAAADPVSETLSTATGSEHVRAARDQLAAVLALDDESDEKMPPNQRCYVAGTLTALEWII